MIMVGTSWARYRRSRALALAGDVDDGADGVDEGPLGTHIGEPGPRSTPRRGTGRPAAQAPEDPPATAQHVVQLAAQHDRQDELRARDGEGPQEGVTSLPRPPLHEHEPLGHLRELVRELHRHAAAEAVADDRRPLVPEHAEEVADAGGVGAEAVVAAGLGALAVAEGSGAITV